MTKCAKKLKSEKTYCLCNGVDDGRLMVYCEKCLKWFHAKCVGFLQDNESSGPWYCPPCMIAMLCVENQTLSQCLRDALKAHSALVSKFLLCQRNYSEQVKKMSLELKQFMEKLNDERESLQKLMQCRAEVNEQLQIEAAVAEEKPDVTLSDTRNLIGKSPGEGDSLSEIIEENPSQLSLSEIVEEDPSQVIPKQKSVKKQRKVTKLSLKYRKNRD